MLTATQSPVLSRGTVPTRGTGGLRTVHAFLLIMLVATGLRFNGITFDSMWLDEAYQTVVDSVGINPQTLHLLADQPIIYSPGEPGSVEQVMWNFRRVDYLCPPLYFLALNRWMTVFGMSDFAIRALSALFSLMAVAVVFLGTRKLFNDKTALFAAGIMAVAPYDIYYAQEARMYSLVTLTASLSCFSFYLLMQQLCRKAGLDGPRERVSGESEGLPGESFGDSGSTCGSAGKRESLTGEGERGAEAGRPLRRNLLVAGYFIVYAVATWAMINSHYTTMLVGVFQGAYGIVYGIKTRNFRLLAVLAAAWVTVLVLWAPWFNLFQQAVAVRDCFYVSREASWWWPFTAIVRIFRNWMSFMTGTRVGAIALGAYATSAVLLASALVVGLRRSPSLAVFRRFRRNSPSPSDEISSSRLALEVVPEDKRGTMLYVLLWALIPPLVALALDVAGNRKTVEISRYLIGTAPAIFILAAIGAQRLWSMGKLKWVVVLHAAFLLTNYAHQHTSFQREPWREMAKLIEKNVDPQELLLISPHLDMLCVNRYFTVPRLQVGTGPLLGNQHIYPLLQGRKSFWFMTAREGNCVAIMLPPWYKAGQSHRLPHGLALTQYVFSK